MGAEVPDMPDTQKWRRWRPVAPAVKVRGGAGLVRYWGMPSLESSSTRGHLSPGGARENQGSAPLVQL